MKQVNLQNALAELKRLGRRLQLKADYTPLPESGGMPFVLRNIDREETARLEKATLRRLGCDNEEKGTKEMDAAGFLESTSIPPRGTARGRLTWPAAESGGLRFLRAAVPGRSG